MLSSFFHGLQLRPLEAIPAVYRRPPFSWYHYGHRGHLGAIITFTDLASGRKCWLRTASPLMNAYTTYIMIFPVAHRSKLLPIWPESANPWLSILFQLLTRDSQSHPGQWTQKSILISLLDIHLQRFNNKYLRDAVNVDIVWITCT